MCGIYGFAGSSKTPNLYKLMLLGVLNEVRGKDSCGFFYNKYVKHGYKESTSADTSLFRDLLIGSYLPIRKKIKEGANNVFIGHNRQMSVGNKNVEGAHPFLYFENKEKEEKYYNHIKTHKEYFNNGLIVVPDMVLTMNGTLKDLNDYGVYVKMFGEDYNFIKNWSNDSRMLGDIIFKHGYHDILKEYRGDAALAWQYPKKEPNTLYLWHGESKTWSTGNLSVERPLHYMVSQEDKGIYYSSDFLHLEAMNQEGAKVEQVPTNKVIKIVNGQIVEQIDIDRASIINSATPYVHTNNNHHNTKYGKSPNYFFGYGYNDEDYDDYEIIGNDSKKVIALTDEVEIVGKRARIGDRGVRFSRGRHYCYENHSTYLAHGRYSLNNAGKISSFGEIYYFHKGYLVLDKTAFDEVDKLYQQSNNKHYEKSLNKHCHPLTIWFKNEKLDSSKDDTQVWYQPGNAEPLPSYKRLNGELKPLFSNYIYKFKDGVYQSREFNLPAFIENKIVENLNVDLNSIIKRLESQNIIFSKQLEEYPYYNFLYNLYSYTGIIYNPYLTVDKNIERVEQSYKPLGKESIEAYFGEKFANYNICKQKLEFAIDRALNLDESLYLNLLRSGLYDINLFFLEFTGTLFYDLKQFSMWYTTNIDKNFNINKNVEYQSLLNCIKVGTPEYDKYFSRIKKLVTEKESGVKSVSLMKSTTIGPSVEVDELPFDKENIIMSMLTQPKEPVNKVMLPVSNNSDVTLESVRKEIEYFYEDYQIHNVTEETFLSYHAAILSKAMVVFGKDWDNKLSPHQNVSILYDKYPKNKVRATALELFGKDFVTAYHLSTYLQNKFGVFFKLHSPEALVEQLKDVAKAEIKKNCKVPANKSALDWFNEDMTVKYDLSKTFKENILACTSNY